MNEPQGAWLRRPGDGTAIVFVHGLLSDGDGCWRSDNSAYWPDLLAHEDSLAKSGIYVFSYRSAVFSGGYSIGDAVEALKAYLELDGLLTLRTLVFVCHSMGGIVARQFLVTRQATLIANSTRIGLFLVASPSLGSGYANLFSVLATALGHAQGIALRFSQDNLWLNDLDRNFMNLKESKHLAISGQELIEDTFVVSQKLIGKQVVEPFSGSRYFGESIKIPGSDHFTIAKPSGRDALQHRLLVQFVQGCRSAATVGPTQQDVIPAPADDETRIRVRLLEPASDAGWREFRGRHVSIGRGPENRIVLDDPKVSWDHGVLALERGVFVYRHLSGTNPTAVRGRGREVMLERGGIQETTLVNQDRITLGGVTLAVACTVGGDDAYTPTDEAADRRGT
jgi:pSer/pThr/pTyr-binding forkhead associated (FHA) protein